MSKLYSEKHRELVLGFEATSSAPLINDIDPPSPPRSIALCHRITYIPCRATVAPWLLRFRVVPRGLSSFLSVSLIKRYLASHPLASSYSRGTASSKTIFLHFFYRSCRRGSSIRMYGQNMNSGYRVSVRELRWQVLHRTAHSPASRDMYETIALYLARACRVIARSVNQVHSSR